LRPALSSQASTDWGGGKGSCSFIGDTHEPEALLEDLSPHGAAAPSRGMSNLEEVGVGGNPQETFWADREMGSWVDKW